MSGIPWWLLLAFLSRHVLAVAFVLVTGIIQGRNTGRYPSVDQWSAALATVQRFSLPGRPAHRDPRRGKGGAHSRRTEQNGQS